jgi:hypothetical protein
MYFKNYKTKSKFLQNNPRSSGAEIIMPDFPMQEHVSIVEINQQLIITVCFWTKMLKNQVNIEI